MFINSSKIVFFFILMIGSLITISSNSWLGAWMGLEINLLSFIPLMTDNNNNNLMTSEASLKYFLIQAFASTVLLFSVILLMFESSLLINKMIYSKMMLLSTLMMKSGIAPFHFWFPNVLEGLSWMNTLILMTWQKIAPLMLMSYVMINHLIYLSIFMSTMIGALGGLNQTSLRKLMAFSSINHLGWMMMAMLFSEPLWILYLMVYSILSMSLIFMFNMFKISHINQLLTMFFYNKNLKYMLFLNLLSLGGLPPFLGFLPKWLVIQTSVLNQQYLLIMFMVIMTLITLFFYLRLCYSTFLFNYSEMNWINFMKFNKNQMMFFSIMSFISIFGLIFISMIYFML